MHRPIADLRVRMKLERKDLDELIEAYEAISRIADETFNSDLQEAATKMGLAIGRIGAEIVDAHP